MKGKKIKGKALICALLLIFSGCSAGEGKPSEGGIAVTDSNGGTVSVPLSPRVVCLYGSYAESWLLAGGELAGVTADAVDERGLEVGAAQIVGTVKEPNAEAILSLEPDWVILNADISGQMDMKALLDNASLRCSCFRVDAFGDYAEMMKIFTDLTQRPELYKTLVEDVQRDIDGVLEAVKGIDSSPSVLLIRAFASGIKAKGTEELAGAILSELGADNIVDKHPSMLEELSVEEIIREDPQYIFITTMGTEEKALAFLDGIIRENPAWQELSAVKAGRCTVLPKELFHYKPNNRWGESYEYLARILYPEIFGE